MLSPADIEALLGCEERAGRTDPYRQVAALLHVIARQAEVPEEEEAAEEAPEALEAVADEAAGREGEQAG